MAGLVAAPGLSDYSASKYGAVAINDAVRTELDKNGHSGYIKTTCICPYFISTGMFEGVKNAFPMYILTPEEVVTRIVAAIQQDEPLVILPWRGNLIYLARLLPVTLFDKMAKAMGMHSQMSDFVGRGDLLKKIPGKH